MRAIILNCTLKGAPTKSNTEALAQVVIDKLESLGCETEMIRIVDENVLPGVMSESQGANDGWPAIHKKIVDAEILIIASPTWMGHPSSLAQRALERLDGMISETQKDGRPAAYDKVAGVVCTGNEDGAHHVISEISGGLMDVGFTIPGNSWTYWNKGPGPGDDYLNTQHGHPWSKSTGEQAAINLFAAATALQKHPLKV